MSTELAVAAKAEWNTRYLYTITQSPTCLKKHLQARYVSLAAVSANRCGWWFKARRPFHRISAGLSRGQVW